MADTDEQKSYYVIDGEQYPRVTHVLKLIDKPGLARWRGRLGNTEADEVSREGSRIGTEFHQVAAEINQGAHMKRGWQAAGEYRHMSAAYIDWLHRYVEKIERVEFTAHSVKHRYAGTLDLLATFRGDSLPSIIDVKTSNYVSVDWPLQLSAYKLMLEESGIAIARRVIVRIPKKGKIEAETYDYKNHAEDDEAWLETLRLWRWSSEFKERQKQALVVAGL